MNSEQPSFSYGRKTIHYTLYYADRKTLEIAVHPDGAVIIKAPVGINQKEIEERLYKRARWIVKQHNYFNQFNPRTPERKYVGGETHLYLGRHYRLKINSNTPEHVSLTRGFFQVSAGKDTRPIVVKRLLNEWYRKKAVIHFNESLDRCWPAFSAFTSAKPPLQIKRMKRRWGSLSKRGMITLNISLIKAPRECIDYVVRHELCHLKHHDHSSAFYHMLERVSPNWEHIKHKLELTLL